MGKITRDISKLSKVPHPQSRKTAQLAKKIVKLDNRKKTKQAHNIRTNLVAEKYIWFKNALSEFDVGTPEEILHAVNTYLGRFDEELEMIRMKHDIGGKRDRQHANREDIIKMTKSNEEEEFKTCGIELPDLLNQKMYKMLKNWDGELRFLQNFKLARFSKTRLVSLIEASQGRKQTGPALSAVSMPEKEAVTAESITSGTSKNQETGEESSNEEIKSDEEAQPTMECD